MKPGSFLLWPTFLVALSAFGFFGCAKSNSGFVSRLERSALSAKGSGDSTVTISAVTDFAWDKLFIFAPYTPVAKIETELGYKWAEAEGTAIQSSDTFYLLVFTKNEKVVNFFKFPRTIGDFQNLEAGNVFPYGGDAFEVKPSTVESKRLILTAKHKEQPSSR